MKIATYLFTVKPVTITVGIWIVAMDAINVMDMVRRIKKIPSIHALFDSVMVVLVLVTVLACSL